MSNLNNLVEEACTEGGRDGVVIYATNNGFDLYLGKNDREYLYSIQCNESDSIMEHDTNDELDDFVDELIDGLYRAFNSNDDFDEDDEDSQVWVEATSDDDSEWSRDDICSWLEAELSQLDLNDSET